MKQDGYTLSRYFNKLVRGIGLLLYARAKPDGLEVVVASIVFDRHHMLRQGNISICVARNVYKVHTVNRRTSFFNPLFFRVTSVTIPYDDIIGTNIHNRVSLAFKDELDRGFVKPVVYSFWRGLRGRGRSKAIRILEETDTTIYVRQSVRNRTYITQRRRNATDDKKLSRKISLAYYMSLFLRWRNVILLYEKESSKYEESAAVLYEKLIDEGYKNAFFVLDENSPHWKYVPDRYRGQIVKKHSLKHYLYFFVAKTFLGTEMPGHAIDLRVANKHAVRKVNSKKLQYVFLQHGVMYMVSLASKARRPARKGEGGVPALTKTVVSSDLEARHFIEHGGYDASDLYISGLPKFDRSVRNQGADKIVIMPTWRQWEYNAIRVEPEKTRYYKMLEDMIASVPSKYRDKIQLLPHPLFIREIEGSNLAHYIKPFDSYDEVLRQTEVLVTDYSSIAYDAFYRGAKVVFWWKEKEYCMEQYKGSLMLNERNIFGDIAYGRRELKRAITANYRAPQGRKYKNRFKKIVEYGDGKNTDRLMAQLRKDGLI